MKPTLTLLIASPIARLAALHGANQQPSAELAFHKAMRNPARVKKRPFETQR